MYSFLIKAGLSAVNQLIEAVREADFYIDTEVQTDTGIVFILDEDDCPVEFETFLKKQLPTTDFQLESIRNLMPIVDELQGVSTWIKEYNTENTDNVYADYCTWGYKESGGIIKGYHGPDLTTEVQKLVDEAQRVMEVDDLDQLLVDCAELQFIDGFHRVDNQLFSLNLGEVYEEVPDELGKQLDELHQAEFDFVQDKSETWFYGKDDRTTIVENFDYSRWALILDEEVFAEQLQEKLEAMVADDENLNLLEVFESEFGEVELDNGETELTLDAGDETAFFYWFSVPGCLPESDPFGPFDTVIEAAVDAIINHGSND